MAWYSLYKWFNSLTEESRKKKKQGLNGSKKKK